ncbi:globin domain-containing protein [Streptomyces sp. CC208A]|uniref:globin domain-containing protein n=1 Tax=Streptomyces sp. CC208A TaxID=3044573 RepID=UPI0024A9F5C7|nr:globin domain-containing protein [Streptomyces sp. CC208A]
MTTADRTEPGDTRQGTEHRRPGAAGGGGRDEYHALLARQDAMRLRQRLLAPAGPLLTASGPSSSGPRPARGTPYSYDGLRDQKTIRRHLPLVTPFDELITHLYRAMFQQHPYLRRLFPDSMDFQRVHLERAFWYLIENLDRPDEVAGFCARLGRDHRKLGVRPVHFEVFEAALAEGLRRTAGPAWVPELEEAWLRMVRFAVAAMVEGADGAVGEPVSWNATVTGHQLRRPDVAVLRVRTAEPFPYRAGQYTSIESPRLPHAWRPYSIACAPRADGELEFHVRRTGSGGLSDVLVTRTGVGDTLRLGPAQGTTTLDADPGQEGTPDVLLVAGGTGWATAKALLEELAARRPRGRTAHLFLGARTLDDLYDTAAVAELERQRPWLRVVPVIGDGDSGDGPASVADAVVRHGDWSDHLAFVSGPPAMVTTTLDRLTGAGLPPGRLRYDPVGGTVPLARGAAARVR